MTMITRAALLLAPCILMASCLQTGESGCHVGLWQEVQEHDNPDCTYSQDCDLDDGECDMP